MIFVRLVLIIVCCFSCIGYACAPAISQSDTSQSRATAVAKIARVDTIPFRSQLIGKTLPYNVVLPVAYDEPATGLKRYPVLYLLHGLTGHYDNWTTRTKLSEYAGVHEMIIVTPEGNDGWYTDSVLSPTEKYETYIIKELIPDVDRRFRTNAQREGRAIAGLSMGGYGALKFGVKYPQLFVFVGSMSGAPEVASWTEEGSFAFIWRSLHPVFGNVGSPTRLANDVPKLYRDLSTEQIMALPFVYLDCGTADPLFTANRSFAEILVTKKIAHEYRQLPGGHSWAYWDAQVQEVLKIAMKKMRTQ